MLIIGIDGCRPDSIVSAAPVPALSSLKDRAAWCNKASNVYPTLSGPNWSTVLCGVNVHLHNVVNNEFTGSRIKRSFPSLFKRLREAKTVLKTASIVTWEPIHTDIVFDDAAIALSFPLTEQGDEAATVAAVKLLSSEACPDLMFFYLGMVDEAGHAHGFGPTSEKYIQAIRTVDEQISRVLQIVETRPKNEDWIIITVTDHGGIAKDHGGNTEEETTVFFWVSGNEATVVRGEILNTGRLPSLLDVAYTAAVHLGIKVDSAWGWEGTARGVRS